MESLEDRRCAGRGQVFFWLLFSLRVYRRHLEPIVTTTQSGVLKWAVVQARHFAVEEGFGDFGTLNS